MRSKPILLGLAVGLASAIAISALAGAREPTPATGAELYERLAGAAAAGDRWAAEYKRTLDEYLKREGLAVTDLGLPTAAQPREVTAGPLRLTVEDDGPWGITISNRTDLGSRQAIEAYRAARTAALLALVRRDPNRELEVVIAPAEPISPADLAGLLACPCAASQLIVDVYSADGWLMSAGRSLDGRDFGSQAAMFEQELLEQISISLDHFPGLGTSDVRFEVRSLRATMNASAAETTSRHPDILLVDPLTDLTDTYADRSAVVRAENPPDVREAHARLVLGQPLDADMVQPEE